MPFSYQRHKCAQAKVHLKKKEPEIRSSKYLEHELKQECFYVKDERSYIKRCIIKLSVWIELFFEVASIPKEGANLSKI